MGYVVPIFQVFNGGIASAEALARVDVERMISHSSVMTNWLPAPIGSMRARPGFERMATGVAASRMEGFAFDGDATALIELRDDSLRVWSNGARVARATQTMTITDGTWPSLSNWTATTPGTTSASVSGGELILVARDDDTPTVEQQITVAAGTHAVTIDVVRGPIRFRVGSTQGDDDLFGETFLDTGEHHLQWVSSGSSFWIQFASETADVQRRVGTVAVASAGDLALATPWGAAALQSLRAQQIGDKLFVGDGAQLQRVIERRANDSWSVVDYDFRGGPFMSVFEHRETLTPSATRGNITLTASAPVFRSTHVGALFQLTHNTQTVTESVSALDAVTETVEITGGENSDRTVVVTIDKTTGSFNGTIVIERAFGDPVNFNTWQTYAGTTDVSETLDEGNDDRIVFVRARVTAYTTGSATITLFAPQGETLGVARILTVASATSATAEVLKGFGDVSAVTKWRESVWSDVNGWPAVPVEHDGRLWWLGNARFWGSESDDFYNFDEDIEGDSAPINRAIGGIASAVRGAASIESQIVVFTAMEERSIQANDLGDIITRDSVNVRRISGQGSNAAAPVVVDDRVFHVDRGGDRPMVFGLETTDNRQKSVRLDFFTDGVFASPAKKVAVQRKPHTRIWYVLDNGDCYVLLYEPSESVQGLSKIEATGYTFLDVAVEPSASGEDRIWVTVQDAESNVVIWRMFKEADARGGDLNRMLDDAVIYESHGSATLTGLDHLDDEVPGVWADGAAVTTTEVVASGSVTLGASVTNAIAGRPYVCDWKSAKIAFGGQGGTALTKRKQITKLGLIGTNICLDGLRIGVNAEFSKIRPIDRMIRSQMTPAGTVFAELDYEMIALPAEQHTDPRILLRNIAPNPATITGVSFAVEVVDG